MMAVQLARPETDRPLDLVKRRFTAQAPNRLWVADITYDLADGRTIEYEHDALRRRVARKVDGTTTHRFLYAGNINPVAEVDAAGNTLSIFVYGSGINVPDYLERGGRTYVFIRDHLGSVRLVVDGNDGTIAQELRYDEYGNITYDSAPGFQPFGFAGGLYDPDTGLVQFGFRDYDPLAGQWTERDPIAFAGRQANLSVYVGNNPMSAVDPSGLWEFAAGVEFKVDLIFLVSISFGVGLETSTTEGARPYLIAPDRAVGLSVGASCTVNAAVGDNDAPWEALFDAIGGNYGVLAGSFFWSPGDGPGWRGASAGGGPGWFPYGVAYTRTRYIPPPRSNPGSWLPNLEAAR